MIPAVDVATSLLFSVMIILLYPVGDGCVEVDTQPPGNHGIDGNQVWAELFHSPRCNPRSRQRIRVLYSRTCRSRTGRTSSLTWRPTEDLERLQTPAMAVLFRDNCPTGRQKGNYR